MKPRPGHSPTGFYATQAYPLSWAAIWLSGKYPVLTGDAPGPSLRNSSISSCPTILRTSGKFRLVTRDYSTRLYNSPPPSVLSYWSSLAYFRKTSSLYWTPSEQSFRYSNISSCPSISCTSLRFPVVTQDSPIKLCASSIVLTT